MSNFYATIARYYDSEHHAQSDDLDLYAALTDEYGDPALIIGSGTGRVMLHLAQSGHSAHGIEIEPEMMRRALDKLHARPDLSQRLTFHQGDALALPLDAQFRTVLLPYNTFMHFHDQDAQIALLRRARQWTARDGVLILDLPNAGESFAAQDTGAVTLERSFPDLDSGSLIMQQSVSLLDRAEQIMEVTWIYDEVTADGTLKRLVVPVKIRYFFLAEMRLLLKLAGFALADVYGDFDGSPFVDGCPRMVIVAAPA
jgi:SAM-dependent methyltransferase